MKQTGSGGFRLAGRQLVAPELGHARIRLHSCGICHSHGPLAEKPDLCNLLITDFLTKDPVQTFAPIRRAPAAPADIARHRCDSATCNTRRGFGNAERCAPVNILEISRRMAVKGRRGQACRSAAPQHRLGGYSRVGQLSRWIGTSDECLTEMPSWHR
jgi:hypothetical protein